jgi:hypothetical protein
MEFDDIVIGSGLSALGAALGTDAKRRVLVIANPLAGKFLYYDDKQTVPCAFSGAGGLGNDWHGVIPTGWRNNFGGADASGFAQLLRYFYPHVELGERLQAPWLFVPWRAVRPRREFERLKLLRADRLTVLHDSAIGISLNARGAEVTTSGSSYRATRVWVAAGALHTPVLLERSFGGRFARGLVSDHAFCYVGQVAGAPAPALSHTREGIFFPARYSATGEALYTLRPARFAFRRLDHGIEQRAVFGLPTGNAMAKIARRASPGLLTEAFFNRFGLFPAAPLHSVYAQVVARDAYAYGSEDRPVQARLSAVRAATDAARSSQPFGGLIASRLPDAYIPGIHLHHSIERSALIEAGLDTDDSPVKVVDASTLDNIGPDHHSFKMMLAAFDRVRKTAGGTSTAPATEQTALSTHG